LSLFEYYFGLVFVVESSHPFATTMTEH